MVDPSSSIDSVSQVIEHHVSGANPGMVGLAISFKLHKDYIEILKVGLAISYALGITGKLSGLVTSFTGSFHSIERNQAWIVQTLFNQQRLRGSWWLWRECSNMSTGFSLSR